MDVLIEEKFGWFKTGKAGGRFCQVYDEALAIAMKLASIRAVKLLFWIIQKMDKDNLISFTSERKKEFLEDTDSGTSQSTAVRAMAELIKYGFVVQAGLPGSRTALYFVNPYYFWRSESKTSRSNRITEFHELINRRKNEEN